MRYVASWMICGALLSGCSAAQHRADVGEADTIANQRDQLTVGSVQSGIRVGMSAAAVLDVLSSPNIVSTDEERREVWVYDRIASDKIYSESSLNLLGGAAAAGGGAAGGVGGLAGHRAGASSTSQRTLTVVVRFDDAGVVRDFSYRTSRF
jgi:hypothetical protein